MTTILTHDVAATPRPDNVAPAGGTPKPARSWLTLTSTAVTVVLLLVLCVLPIVLVVVGSITGDTGHPGAGAWSRALDSTRTLSSIGYSFLLAIRVPIALVVALGLAWLLTRVRIPGHKAIMTALWAAFFLPTLPVTLGWILLLDPQSGLLNVWLEKLPGISGPVVNIYSITGITLVHLTLSGIPIMTILLSAAQRQLDSSYEEASAMCGVRRFRTFRRVTLPLLMPAILFAVVVGLIKSLEQFEVEQLLGVPADIYVYGTRIYDLVGSDPADIPQAMALSTLFIVVLVALALCYQIMLHRRGAIATLPAKGSREPTQPSGRWPYVVSALVWVGVTIAIILPTVVLVIGSFNTRFGFFDIKHPWTTANWQRVLSDPQFVSAITNSLTIGLVVGVGGTILFGVLAWCLGRRRLAALGSIGVLVWLPYALPGVLLGVSFLDIFLRYPVVNALYGTIVPLIIVLLVQGMPMATLMLKSSVEQVPTELEESSLMSGVGMFRTIRKITVPLILPMITSVFLIVFMGAFRDISATVLLATPGTQTLPLLMFQSSINGATEEAAVVGVVMLGASMLVMLIAARFGRRIGGVL